MTSTPVFNSFAVPQTPFGIDELLTRDEPPLRAYSRHQHSFFPARHSNNLDWQLGYSTCHQDLRTGRWYNMSADSSDRVESATPSEPLATLREYEESLRRALECASRNELRQAAVALRDASERLKSGVNVLRKRI